MEGEPVAAEARVGAGRQEPRGCYSTPCGGHQLDSPSLSPGSLSATWPKFKGAHIIFKTGKHTVMYIQREGVLSKLRILKQLGVNGTDVLW